MPNDIRESDWKIFRQVHEAALARFCDRALAEAAAIVGDRATGSHQRYLKLYKLLERRDKELGDAFNDLRRSTAMFQLAIIRSRGLVTDEEFARFSDELRDRVNTILQITR